MPNTTQTVSDFRRIAGDAGIDMTTLAQALMSTNTALAGSVETQAQVLEDLTQ